MLDCCTVQHEQEQPWVHRIAAAASAEHIAAVVWAEYIAVAVQGRPSGSAK